MNNFNVSLIFTRSLTLGLLLFYFCPLFPETLPKSNVSSFKIPNKTLLFQENRGQLRLTDGRVATDVLYKASLNGLDVYLTNKGLSYIFTKRETKKIIDGKDSCWYSYSRFDIELKDARITPRDIIALKPSSSEFNFFYGHCPMGINSIKEYEQLNLKNVYPGIDFILYGSDKGLKYDFVVNPGSDPKKIILLYKSEKALQLVDGQITVTTPLGDFFDNTPKSYVEGSNLSVKSNYTILKQTKKTNQKTNSYETEIGFDIGLYPKEKTLIIDPLQLWWGTYYGGTNGSEGTGVTTDQTGNVFILGNTNSNDIPLQPSGSLAYFQGTYGGAINGGGLGDAFILKFTNTGQLLWATYFGGSAIDKGADIKCDKNGNVFVTGYTYSTDFPVKNPGGNAFFDSTNSSSIWIQEIFISKFDNNGKYLWGTYYGSPDIDVASSLSIDNNNNIYVTGATNSPAFPVFNPGNGAFFQGTFGAGLFSKNDCFLLKFSNTGALLLASYLGGNDEDYGTSTACDPNGNVYFYGYTSSQNFFTLNPGNGAYYQDTLLSSGGSFNTFILKLNSTCQPIWSTYLGGSTTTWASMIACDSAGNLFATGSSTSYDFPTVNPGGGAFYQPFNNNDIVFISKFNFQSKLTWSTFFGKFSGYGNNTVKISTRKCQEIYISFPVQPNVFDTLQVKNPGNGIYYDATYSGTTYNDIFLASFTNSGAHRWGSFFGGVGQEASMVMTTDRDGNLFYTGQQGCAYYYNSSDLSTYTSSCIVNPGNNTYFQALPNCAPGITAYCVIGKFLNQDMTHSFITTGCNLSDTIQVIVNGGFTPYTYSWSNGSTSSSIHNIPPGTYTCAITDLFGCSETETIQIGFPIISTNIPGDTICKGQTVALSAQGANSYSWAPPNGLNSTTASSVNASPATNTIYTVTGSTQLNCTSSQTVSILVNQLPIISASGNDSICGGDSSIISAAGALNYSWIPVTGLNTSSGTTVHAGPTQTQAYTIIGQDNNGCIDSSHFTLNVFSLAQLQANGPFSFCIGKSTQLTASGADTYQWIPNTGLSTTSGTQVIASPASNTSYTLIGTKAGMCVDSVSFNVNVLQLPAISISAPDSACEGQEVQISSTGNGNFSWAPASGLNCSQCPNPVASINSTTQYVATLTDSNSCSNKDSLTIAIINGCGDNIFIPNVFSPNGDGINDLFTIKADKIASFSCTIYNRWGIKVFESDNQNISWDGRTTAGNECVNGTYFCLINIKKFNQEIKTNRSYITLVK